MRLEPSPDIDVDGDFGPQTEAALILFQEQHGLPASGRMDTPTWKALGTLVEKGPEVPRPAEVNSAQLPRDPADPLDGPPVVSCRAWGIMDVASGEMLWSFNEAERLNPASTTKIMTALVSIREADQDAGLFAEGVVFSERADQTEGSTAGVNAGEIVPLGELLYGLLLPSGNDASVALAEHLGRRASISGGSDGSNSDPLETFVDLMNRTAADLGLQDTFYHNPHGLTVEGHLTSVRDLAKLARHGAAAAPLSPDRGHAQRGCVISSQKGYTRNVVWKNTNRLLGIEGFHGIKTGTTRAAGACLVSCGSRNGRELIVVTLGSASSDGRYVDTRNLFRWAWQQLDASPDTNAANGTAPRRERLVEVTPAAQAIHDQALLVDGHNDLPWRFRELGTPSFDQVDIRQPQPQLHTDIPRLLQGGVGAQFWSVYVPVETSQEGKALLTTLEQIALVKAMVQRYPEVFRLALTHDDILTSRREGKIACLMGVEGGHCIENSLNVLRQLYRAAHAI